MKTALIGYTGFVGSNIAAHQTFDDYYNSKNIQEIVGKEYDLVISSGIAAEKYLANAHPEKDLANIQSFLDTLCQVKIGQLVFISTVDVYKNPIGQDESSVMDQEDLHAYGKNRLYAEEVVRKAFPSCLIVRLPALFGRNLKKNFIYDFLTKIPTMLTAGAHEQLMEKLNVAEQEKLTVAYEKNEVGNFVFKGVHSEELKSLFERHEATSLNFTDARSSFQFYNLAYLTRDIEKALEAGIDLLNITSQPVSAKEIAEQVFQSDWNNVVSGRQPVAYDLQSRHAAVYGGQDGYLYSADQVLADLTVFVAGASL